MALYCPNKNLKEWKDLESSVGEDKAMLMWYESEGQIGYSMKATDIVTKNISKINGWFKQIGNTDVFWNKIQKDLGIPKEQVELFKNSKGNTIEEKLVSFASEYSYTVEVNTAKTDNAYNEVLDTYEYDIISKRTGYSIYRDNEEFLTGFQTEREAKNKIKELKIEDLKPKPQELSPTNYYSNLTVPGGTNYTENEIATPSITPSIKGHAQFSTNEGIGWFRSDDKEIIIPSIIRQQGTKAIEEYKQAKVGLKDTSTKTRRILEVQSDLFQKGRDKKSLTETLDDTTGYGGGPAQAQRYKESISSSQNQFLQLLNKDNNWVTFFVKSIVQDSAKKGYEKVLFPSGNTASKVEGHSTLEEFKKQKEDRLKELEKKENRIKLESEEEYEVVENEDKGGKFYTVKYKNGEPIGGSWLNKEGANQAISNRKEDSKNRIGAYSNEINQLKQELERVDKEGFGALKPIYSFYENNISNILKKQGYNPKQVTDEYGNTWNEVTIGEKESKTILLKEDDKITKVLLRYGINQSGFSTAYSTSKQQLADALKNAGAVGYEVKKAYNGNLYVVNNNGKIIKPFIEESSEKSEINQLFPESDTTSNANMIEIIKNNGTEIEKEIVSLLSDFIDETTPVDFVDVVDADNSQGSFEYYKGKPGEIKIRNGVNNVPRVYIHELTHEATSKLVDEYLSGDKSKLSKEQLEAASNIAKLYFELKKNYDVGEYGFRNIHEFISEVWSNKEFQNKLNKIEYKNSNAFSKFLEFVSKLLGLNKNSALSEALNESFALMNAPKISNKIGMESGVFKLKKSDKQIDSPFEEQFVFFKRRISTLEKQLFEEAKGSVKALKLEERILALSTKLDKAYQEQDEESFTELGMMALAEAEDYINKVEAVPSKANKDNLLYAVNILQSFYEFDNLATESRKLFKRAFPLILSHNLKTINQFASEGFEITENMINAQVKDIGTFKSSVGALADLANYIGRTIGSLIKAAQNRASTANKLYKNEVQKHVDALTIYAKENGKTLEQVYDMFINETENDIRLIQSEIYVDGEAVPNAEFDKIKSSKTLLDFYLFYQESLKNADSNLPYKVGKHHIPNINKANSIVYDLTHVLAKHNVLYDQFKSNEELYADMVPQQYRNRMSKDKKSRDLGASLLDFVAYSNNYNELSKVLAEARLLQEQLKWVRSSDGSIKKREFTKSSQPDVRVFAEQTNLWKMINTVIDMQLKGHMTKKQGEIKGKKIYDAEGNEIGYEARYWSDVADVGLKYNSLLKIGLSPITAVTNILFGDISNVIEAVGGRYFGMKDLAVATNIFGANALTKDSLLFKYLERINPLQELDDYNLTDKVKLKKMSAQKLQEYMYSMQKRGELFLQSRTMLAVMLKEGYIDNSGKLTSEGEKMMKDEARVTQFSDKIQRINQLIHGRYSSREAAAMQQSVFYRLAMQFRKWMPSAIESRVGEKQYDNRLGMEIEGRYLTLARLVASKDVFNNLIKMSKGELSELEMYNMRKNLIELTILTATLLAYLKLTEGDDDEDKKRRKNPYVKLGLTLLNRISGDLEFFYNPSNIVSLTSNSIPLASVAKDLIKTVGSLPSAFYYGDYEYKAGSLKGRNKFWANLTKITPGARPIQDVWKIINKNPLDF